MPKLKNQRHHADLWCSTILAKHPNIMAMADHMRQNKDKIADLWPDWCVFPMAATHSMLPATRKDVECITAAISWSRFKAIYRFDPTLALELIAQPMEDKLPIDCLLTLPFGCIYLELPPDNSSADKPVGAFVWLEAEDTPLLMITLVSAKLGHFSLPITLNGGTIDDSLQSLKAANATIAKRLPVDFDQYVVGIINMALYIAAENADIPSELVKHRATDGYGNVRRATVWDVGLRIGRALREYREREQVEAVQINSAERSSPRGHIRRAHWHHFWIGSVKEGTRRLVLRWLPPIPVNLEAASNMPAVLYMKK